MCAGAVALYGPRRGAPGGRRSATPGERSARSRVQDRDEIQDHGPDADGREEDVVDDAAAVQEEEEGDGEDLLDDNMYKYAPHPANRLAPA